MPQTIKTLQVGDLKCEIVGDGTASNRIVYMIYPAMAVLPDNLIEDLSTASKVSIVVVYVPSDQWNNYLTPWPEPGEAKGFPPFAGQASDFLKALTAEVIPQTDVALSLTAKPRRDLMGVSLSGLFTLWAWLLTDTFTSIACLSGSFWYAGFIEWFNRLTIPAKKGSAYFLLGRDEPKASIKAYRTVGVNTEIIVTRLKNAGIETTFQWVPGNHFSDPEGRARLAFTALTHPSVNGGITE